MSAVETLSSIEGLLRESGLPRREAEVLLLDIIGGERVQLISRAEGSVDPTKANAARARFARRRAGEPVAYIIGRREFYGLALRVTPDVLIPRPETELLVELALERLPSGSRARVLELGTGSGAIALALASHRPGVTVVATDVSDTALDIARGNARELGVVVSLVRSDWFAAIGAESFDLVISNPPYVAAGDPHLQQGDLLFEPPHALVGGDDGLDCLRTIATGTRPYLVPGGALLLEHGYDQGESCVALLQGLGYADVADHSDLAGLSRACIGAWRG